MTRLAFIKNDTLISLHNTGTRVDFKDVGVPVSVSPTEDGWSYKDWRLALVQRPEPAEGKQESSIVELIDGVPYYVLEDAPPEAFPDRVTSRQFFLQLSKLGLLDQVNQWVSLQTIEVRLAFEKSGTFVREDPMLQLGFQVLGFTTEQVDAFFIAASDL